VAGHLDHGHVRDGSNSPEVTLPLHQTGKVLLKQRGQDTSLNHVHSSFQPGGDIAKTLRKMVTYNIPTK